MILSSDMRGLEISKEFDAIRKTFTLLKGSQKSWIEAGDYVKVFKAHMPSGNTQQDVSEFVHKMLEVFGFGPKFCTWIKILYTGGRSCIKNNGFISDFFNIERSARQGDPISPLIFKAISPLIKIFFLINLFFF